MSNICYFRSFLGEQYNILTVTYKCIFCKRVQLKKIKVVRKIILNIILYNFSGY